MNRNNLIIKIRNVLDLNLYEAKVYLAVIAYAPIKRNDVFKRADIPQSRIYDIIVNLKNKGLINSFKKNKDEYYQALDPSHIAQILGISQYAGRAGYKGCMFSAEELYSYTK